MPDRKKVIKGIECIITDGKCDLFNCAYEDVSNCINAVLSDALALLKEQEAVVHCRDCKHSKHWYGDKCRCFLWHETGIDVFNDGFCNYGERKEGR